MFSLRSFSSSSKYRSISFSNLDRQALSTVTVTTTSGRSWTNLAARKTRDLRCPTWLKCKTWVSSSCSIKITSYLPHAGKPTKRTCLQFLDAIRERGRSEIAGRWDKGWSNSHFYRPNVNGKPTYFTRTRPKAHHCIQRLVQDGHWFSSLDISHKNVVGRQHKSKHISTTGHCFHKFIMIFQLIEWLSIIWFIKEYCRRGIMRNTYGCVSPISY